MTSLTVSKIFNLLHANGLFLFPSLKSAGYRYRQVVWNGLMDKPNILLNLYYWPLLNSNTDDTQF